MLLALWSAVAFAADTVLYVVRHAEKDLAVPADPPLTPAGRSRADALARLLRDVPLAGVHSTATARTRATAGPAAAGHALSVATYDDPAPLVAALRAAGGAHLVVGHSNTIDAIVTLAGGAGGAPVGDGEYDRLYVVVAPDAGPVVTQVLRYGE
jgi:broad specificity phosphatase PhoE